MLERSSERCLELLRAQSQKIQGWFVFSSIFPVSASSTNSCSFGRTSCLVCDRDTLGHDFKAEEEGQLDGHYGFLFGGICRQARL